MYKSNTGNIYFSIPQPATFIVLQPVERDIVLHQHMQLHRCSDAGSIRCIRITTTTLHPLHSLKPVLKAAMLLIISFLPAKFL